MPSWKKFWRSLPYALKGLKTAWQTQNNFRWHICILAVVLALGLWLQLSRWEWLGLILTSSLVLVLELVNTIVEKLVDLEKPRVHVFAEMIKDVMAGATLITALAAILVGCLIFWPHLFKY